MLIVTVCAALFVLISVLLFEFQRIVLGCGLLGFNNRMLIKGAIKMFKRTAQFIILLGALLTVTSVNAEDVLAYLTDANGRYTGPSVEECVALMDTDKNGFADVFEVRAFLELKHGIGYEKDVLDRMEASAKGTSCSTPFAKELYTN